MYAKNLYLRDSNYYKLNSSLIDELGEAGAIKVSREGAQGIPVTTGRSRCNLANGNHQGSSRLQTPSH